MSAFSFYDLGATLLAGTVDTLSKLDDMKKMNQLSEEIQSLSLKQQQEIENRIAVLKTESEKLDAIYKYLAIAKYENSLKKMDRKRLFLLIGLGFGALVLVGIIIKLKK